MLNKVMLIDDSMVDRYIGERVIQKSSIASSVISLDSAQLALTFLSAVQGEPTELPEIILLDINMPGMDGFSFLREFEALEDSIKQYCSIFMVTSSMNANDYAIATACKYVKGYINKPLNTDKLNEAVAKIASIAC